MWGPDSQGTDSALLRLCHALTLRDFTGSISG
jgi:hypothetical protein